ncbi:uncharacterized protein LOC128257169 [Drosophila gunungcola]|uniref:uncharacterized protein LOC128257169 n=1 Tax=Drosophila gunungcola TaxID=103775 RepID=UPI0022E49CFA|nr:uncharacterized protein LOC128257169 [Drosophila gunungcola]
MFGAGHNESNESPDIQKEWHQGQKAVQLLDLPIDVLDRVMSHLDPWHHKMWRSVSEELKQVHNSFILHHHKCYEVAHREMPMESIRVRDTRIMLQILRQSVGYFVHEGVAESHIVDSLMTFHEELPLSYNDEGIPKADPLTRFLGRFLLDLELSTDDKREVQDRRLHYTMAVFGLLKWCGMKLLHWHLQVELANICFGGIDEREDKSRFIENVKRIYFINIIAELLFYDKMNKNFWGHKNTDNFICTYGIGPSSSDNSRLLLKFVVYAPKSVVDLLQDVIAGKDDPSKPFQMPPESDFSAHVEIKSVCARKFMYSGTLHLNILRLAELV